MKFITTAATFLLGSVGITYAQQTLPICADESLMETVEENHGEKPVATGIMQNGAIQVWASEDGDSWTLFVITPDQICVVFIGNGFEVHGAEYPDEGT